MGAGEEQHALRRRMQPLARLVMLGVLLTLLPSVQGAARELLQQQEGYSCNSISEVPLNQQCSFIREHCPSESVVPYAEWYFCHIAPRHVLLRSWYLLAVCCLLPLAFCLLGDTAEFYIAPIMAHVSQAIPKMRPRFAGVTFVALGNGAPDLSANIAAISAGEVVLSAGAFTGAAMFVQCVVAAELIALAGDHGIKCGGAMLRDVGVYCLAILSVLLAFSLGQINRAFVGWAVALYVVYMIWVFAGDEWHHRGRPKPQLDGQSFKAILNRIASRGALPQAANGGGRRSSGGGSSHAAMGYSSREDLEETLLPWVVAEDEEVDDSYMEQYTPLDLRTNSAGPPPDFEVQMPSPVSASPLGYAAAAGPAAAAAAAGGPLGSRPSSFTSQAVQQRSTEMSATAGAVRAVDGFPAHFSQRGSSSRRVSEPSFAGGAGSSGGGSTGAADWSAAPGGTQRHASASLPITPATAVLQRQQYSTLTIGGSIDWNPRQQQQQQLGGARQPHVAHPHVMSLGKQSFIDPKTYKQLVWADLADDEEEEARLEREIARQLIVGAGRSRAAAAAGATAAAGGAGGSYQPPAMSSAAGSPPGTAEHQQQLQSPAALSTPRTPADVQRQQQQQQQQHGHHLQQQLQAQGAAGAAEDGAFLSPFGSSGFRTGPNTPRSAEALTPGALDASVPGQPDKGFVQGWGSPQVGFSSAVQQQGLQPVVGAAGAQQQQLGLADVEAGGGGGDNWQQLQWQVTLGNSEEWVDAGPVRQLFRKVTFPLLLPAYLAQRLTIPFASASGYSREWLISSLLCFPLALIGYLGLVSLPGVLVACGVGISAAVLGAALTAWDAPGQMAVQGLGGKAAAVFPGVLAVLAFCMGVVWIDTIATEVVGIITFLAGLASLPSGVMGLTLLAWGNSLGDYFGNRAMAKAGHTSTAITACFAAPLFNMLISLACGFSSYLHKLGVSSVRVNLTPEVALGCLFLVGYNITIIAVGRLNSWRLPPWFRYFARAWYGLYFTLAVASGFYQQHSSQSS